MIMTALQVVVQAPPPIPPVPQTPLDVNQLAEMLVPLIGIVAVVIVGAVTLRWLFQSPMAQAMAERIRARTRDRFGGAGEESERVAGLEHQVTMLQGQVNELAERVDFAERMLAERRERKLS